MRHLSLLTFLALTLAVSSLSAQGSDNKGKFYFKKSCKTCHSESSGQELTPLSKTQAQWKKFFQTSKHQGAPLTKLVTAEQALDIQTFLVNHASDSPSPQTCGSN
jgi:CxxC motif-containing protein (DUF1111 family)